MGEGQGNGKGQIKAFTGFIKFSGGGGGWCRK